MRVRAKVMEYWSSTRFKLLVIALSTQLPTESGARPLKVETVPPALSLSLTSLRATTD